jgi:hypothetical protein
MEEFVNDPVSFAPEIQAMLQAHGDSRRPRLDTAIVVQKIVRSQMRETLEKSANVARSRISNQIELEDVIFTMRSDPVRVQRLIKYLSVKDMASNTNANSKPNPLIAGEGNRVRRCKEFLYNIDYEGGLLRRAADEELLDASRLERLKRLDRLARDLDARHYAEFTRARQVGFIGHKHRFSQKFYIWLTTDGTGRAILADDLVDMVIDQSALEVFGYLAHEAVGLLVDMALVVQQDELGKTDNIKRMMNPVTYNPQMSVAPRDGGNASNVDPSASVDPSNHVDSKPLEPHHVREAVNRVLNRPRPLDWLTKASGRLSGISPRLF